jgi:hypothetical protein
MASEWLSPDGDLGMALKREPLKHAVDPGYPTLECYALSRPMLLGVVSVAVLAFAGCAHRLRGDLRPASSEERGTETLTTQETTKEERR